MAIAEITTTEQIKSKMVELQTNYDLVTVLLNQVTALKTKLKLDLSPDCKELGKYASFVVSCRDTIIDGKILGLVVLLDRIMIMYRSLDPAIGMTNKEFNETLNKNEKNNN